MVVKSFLEPAKEVANLELRRCGWLVEVVQRNHDKLVIILKKEVV